MITVEPTPNNRRIYSELCDINEIFVSASVERREILLAEAMELCEELDL